MKHKIDIDQWNRKEHFNFFRQFDDPYYGVTVQVNCTKAYARAKDLGVSFFIYYLHKSLIAINAIENFKYRIEGPDLYLYDTINASATILRADHTFGFSYIKYDEDFTRFNELTKAEIERVKNTTGLFTFHNTDNSIIHFSALPWVNFSAISQSGNFKSGDSCPKISTGKVTGVNGEKLMPFDIHVHHGLVDGYHLGLFFDKLQTLLDE